MSRNFLGVDEKLDKIFSNLMSDDSIKNSLLKILGKITKLTHVQFVQQTVSQNILVYILITIFNLR